MNIGEIGNEIYIQVFQQFFNKYPTPLNYDQQEKLVEYVQKHEYRLTRIGYFEYYEETVEHKFAIRKENRTVTLRQPAIHRKQRRVIITEEETATYLLYTLILQDFTKINTALELANKSKQNIRNWLKYTNCKYHIQLPY
jgi:hypothetical protein